MWCRSAPCRSRVGGQGVAGLAADVVAAEVEFVDPVAEASVEGAQADGLGALAVAPPGGEQRRCRVFGGGGWRPCHWTNFRMVLLRR